MSRLEWISLLGDEAILSLNRNLISNFDIELVSFCLIVNRVRSKTNDNKSPKSSNKGYFLCECVYMLKCTAHMCIYARLNKGTKGSS